jgi:hypothetical protein
MVSASKFVSFLIKTLFMVKLQVSLKNYDRHGKPVKHLENAAAHHATAP